MIELDRVENQYGEQDVELWADNEYLHVIVREDWVNHSHDPGWYVRDEDGERGAFRSFAEAFNAAELLWAPVGDVTLAPARRLVADIAESEPWGAGQFLLEYLAAYGAVGIDVQALAEQVFARQEEE